MCNTGQRLGEDDEEDENDFEMEPCIRHRLLIRKIVCNKVIFNPFNSMKKCRKIAKIALSPVFLRW